MSIPEKCYDQTKYTHCSIAEQSDVEELFLHVRIGEQQSKDECPVG